MSKGTQLDEPLIGYIVLDEKFKDTIPAVLRDTGTRIELSVPFKDVRRAPGCWFVSSWQGEGGSLVVGSQIPDSMPHELLFVCNERSFALAGCRTAGMTMAIGRGAGTGTIVPTYVVCGGKHNRYAEINGLRTQCSDLVDWFNLQSMTCEAKYDEEGKCESVDVRSQVVPPLVIDERIGFVARPHFGVNKITKTNSVISHQSVFIETNVNNAIGWERHLAVHCAVKDLMSISDWNSREFTDMSVLRLDDPKLIVEEKIVQEKWSPVISYLPLVQRDSVDNLQSHFLFSYQDISNDGINRWMKLQDNCKKGMTLLSYLARDHEHLALETLSMLVGTTLECVGWYIVSSENQKERMNPRFSKPQPGTYSQMLDAIIEKFDESIPIVDAEEWKRTMRNVYVGNKHADAPVSDYQTMYQATMQGLIILRMWVGAQLGANVKKMRERLPQDEIGKKVRSLLA